MSTCGVHLLVLCILRVFTLCSAAIWYFPQNKTWKNAQSQCRDQGGHLVQITDTTLNEVMDCLTEENTTVWGGGYTTYNPKHDFWIEVIGCFKETDIDQDIENNFTNLMNTPEMCQIQCRNSSMFATKDKKCYCIQNLSNPQTLKIGAKYCSIRCSGNVERYCGGIDHGGLDYVNVYKTFRYEFPNQQLACMKYGCFHTTGQRKFNFTEGRCYIPSGFICADRHIVTEPYFEMADAVNRCDDRNTYLWGPSSNVLQCNSGQPQDWYNKSFWSNIFRNYKMEWIIDDTVATPRNCFSMSISNSRLVMKPESCQNKLLPFLCQNGKKWNANAFTCSESNINETSPDTPVTDTKYERNTTEPVALTSEIGTEKIIGIIVGISLSIVLSLMATIVIVYYKRRNLKKQNSQTKKKNRALAQRDLPFDNYELAASCTTDEGETKRNTAIPNEYEFATIPQTEEIEIEVYTKSMPGEYDVIGKTDARRIDNTGWFGNTYSHTMINNRHDNYDKIGIKENSMHHSDSYSHMRKGIFGHAESAYDTTHAPSSNEIIDTDNSYSHVHF